MRYHVEFSTALEYGVPWFYAEQYSFNELGCYPHVICTTVYSLN